MNYPIPGYPHGVPGKGKCPCTIGMSEKSHPLGVVYRNAPVGPLRAPPFAPMYGQSGEHGSSAKLDLTTCEQVPPYMDQYYNRAM